MKRAITLIALCILGLASPAAAEDDDFFSYDDPWDRHEDSNFGAYDDPYDRREDSDFTTYDDPWKSQRQRRGPALYESNDDGYDNPFASRRSSNRDNDPYNGYSGRSSERGGLYYQNPLTEKADRTERAYSDDYDAYMPDPFRRGHPARAGEIIARQLQPR